MDAPDRSFLGRLRAGTKKLWARLFPSRRMIEVFGSHYRNRATVWRGEHSASGRGSDPDQTVAVLRALPLLVKELGVAVLLDAPCGDFAWMRNADLAGIQYVGVDVVPELIEGNRRRYAAAQREFRMLDISRDRLPPADLILCRDCLVHFSLADAWRTLSNFRRSGAAYLLTTTFPRTVDNVDIPTGSWRPLNLEKPPFCFPPPLRVISEECTVDEGRWPDKSLGLWRCAELPF